MLFRSSFLKLSSNWILLFVCISHSTVNSVSTIKWTGALCIGKISDVLYITIEWRCLKHMMTSNGMGGVKWLPSSRRYLSLGMLSGSWKYSLSVKGQIAVPLIARWRIQWCLIKISSNLFTGVDKTEKAGKLIVLQNSRKWNETYSRYGCG